ncbi:SMI1/KNR4 family protein [Paenibacillus kandeliae]|uniref:SMI1/KNR4 family protein n=1 Tax=Paenibacillus kandeliae TaxID=3231269 RepID=UPI003459E0D1
MDTKAQQLWRDIIQHAMNINSCTIDQLHLRQGATFEQFVQLEQTLAVSLPEPMKQLYSIHDGQEETLDINILLRNLTFLSVQRIIETWQFLQEEFDPDGWEPDAGDGVKPFLWNPRWIPFATNGAGDYVCIDTDPAADGVQGQVLYFWHDWESRTVEANDFFQFVEMCLQEEE